MHRIAILALLMALIFAACSENSPKLDQEFRGAQWTPNGLEAQFWIPDAEAVALHLYDAADQLVEKVALKGGADLWQVQESGNYEGMFYTLAIQRNGTWAEDTDPYAKAVGTNGKKAALINFAQTNPKGWEQDGHPDPTKTPIIYELQVRDFSMDPKQNFEHPGKFLAFTERGLVNEAGQTIGLDHLIEMGISHVHLLPFFDFASNDESNAKPAYNWGYDPLHFNAVEGSFATDAADPKVRIRECKQMIQALHQAGIGVIMDVVYNHTSGPGREKFEHLAPGYFFRYDAEGNLSNASACGNETASEKEEMRRFMLQSLQYWVEEYHLDGFRFDLMAIHDIATMQEIDSTLTAQNPNVLLYGEGWTAGGTPIPYEELLFKCHTKGTKHVAAFSDEFRNGLKGNVFNEEDPGYVGGELSAKANVMFGLVGAVEHPQVDLELVTSNDCGFWAPQPEQCIAYASCHDNHTVYDKLHLARPAMGHEELILRSGIAHGLVLTSIGRPFLHAGGAMGRTKQGVENSYNAPDSINAILWDWKTEQADLVAWVQSLTALRKEHPVWQEGHRMSPADRVDFLDSDAATLSYLLRDPDGEAQIWVVARVGISHTSPEAPTGNWKIKAAWPEGTSGMGIGMWVYEKESD